MDDAVREQLIHEIEQALSISRSLGGDYEISVRYGYPALYNDPLVAGWVRDTATDLIAAQNVIDKGFEMGGEDFGFMSRASQGMMMLLGTKKPDGPIKYFHHPEFDIDENALPIGAAILAETALRFVRGN